MKRTLGGDRIGSGSNMSVELSGYQKSTHNLNTDIATTMSIGTLVPIHHSVILAGDTREIDIDAMLMTHPTEGPLFGSFKLQVDVYKADMRLYIAKLHMNLLEVGMEMKDIKLPQIVMEADKIDWTKNPNNQQINPSSIFKYLHMSGIGDTSDQSKPWRSFNAIPWLMYWDVYRNYYANKQEKIGAVIHTGADFEETVISMGVYIPSIPDYIAIPQSPASQTIMLENHTETTVQVSYAGQSPGVENVVLNTTDGPRTLNELFTVVTDGGTGVIDASKVRGSYVITSWRYVGGTDVITTEPKITTFDLSLLDDMKMDILSAIKSTTAFELRAASISPFGLALQNSLSNNTYSKQHSQEGLALKTYQSDLFNNWLNTEYIDGVNGVNARTAIQTDAEGKFTIDNFLIKQKMYDYLNRIAVAGATVEDMMEVTYDVKTKTRSEIPTFEGGMSKELIFQQVISNTATENQPLGTIAGRGTTQGHKGGKIRITNEDTQHGYYMVIASLTPRLKYTQGNGWATNLRTYEDLHRPAFDQIGFQNLITDQMASWDTKASGSPTPIFNTAGKQPAWINYQTEIDRAFGNFAIQSSEGWMILDRNYDWNAETRRIGDLTTYIDPSKYNGIFAYQALDAQNIWAQFKIEDRASRKMSANQMPKM